MIFFKFFFYTYDFVSITFDLIKFLSFFFYGNTPLHKAVMNHNLDIVNSLRKGEDYKGMNIKNILIN